MCAPPPFFLTAELRAVPLDLVKVKVVVRWLPVVQGLLYVSH